ncbi:F-box domain-containing protein [Leptodontidium sp. MPI-SDFR-AT-0119]|nr:F-box domain-containing protein [Leptodontidium sp. MPI-SDFR-AT-0119]
MTNLIALPNEILHNIFRHVDPVDLAHLSTSCRFLNDNIASDGQLYRAVYCQILDEPSKDHLGDIDYEAQLKDLVRYRYILSSSASVEEKIIHLPFIETFTTTLLQTASPTPQSSNITLLKAHISTSRPSTTNLEAFLSQSQTYNRASLSPTKTHAHTHASLTPLPLRQASAKLHVLYGKPLLLPRRTHFQTPYPYAVSMVYDLRNYTEETLWGPYMGDGLATVDWEKLEAVMLVLGHNVESFRNSIGEQMLPRGLVWKEGWRGASPYSYTSVDIAGVDSDDEEEEEEEESDVGRGGRGKEEEGVKKKEDVEDPYNITGTWMRVVCFLDFHDLFAYNFTSPTMPPGTPRPALQTTEAIRLITMELRVTHSEPPGPDDGQSHPIVYFEGVSRSLHSAWDANANSNIRGNVRITKEGEVRWQSISVYNGEERWRSEGIQIGGIQSARGVLGHWFDKDHDVHGPAGPTAFYKVSDQIKKRAPALEDDEDESNVWHLELEQELDEEDEEEVQAFIGQLAQSIGLPLTHGLGHGNLHGHLHHHLHGHGNGHAHGPGHADEGSSTNAGSGSGEG